MQPGISGRRHAAAIRFRGFQHPANFGRHSRAVLAIAEQSGRRRLRSIPAPHRCACSPPAPRGSMPPESHFPAARGATDTRTHPPIHKTHPADPASRAISPASRFPAPRPAPEAPPSVGPSPARSSTTGRPPISSGRRETASSKSPKPFLAIKRPREKITQAFSGTWCFRRSACCSSALARTGSGTKFPM